MRQFDLSSIPLFLDVAAASVVRSKTSALPCKYFVIRYLKWRSIRTNRTINYYNMKAVTKNKAWQIRLEKSHDFGGI